jgi:hypothetical protein
MGTIDICNVYAWVLLTLFLTQQAGVAKRIPFTMKIIAAASKSAQIDYRENVYSEAGMHASSKATVHPIDRGTPHLHRPRLQK